MLYCFECGHESLVDGDWLVRANGDGVDVDCPECETTIATRQRTSDVANESEDVCCSCPAD